MMKSKFSKKIWILFIAGLFLLVGISVVTLVIISPVPPKPYSFQSGVAPIFWEQQDGGFTAKNAAGTFEIKAFVIFNPKIFIFYAFQPITNTDTTPGKQLELSQITAFSTQGSSSSNYATDSGETPRTPRPTPDAAGSTPLKVTGLQPIGTFGKTAVGMITLEVPDNSGQQVSLKITTPHDPQSFWEVTPLHQTYPMNGSTTHFAYTDLDINNFLGPFYTGVRVESSGVGGNNLLGVFDVSSESSNTPPLHLQLDVQGNLSPFTQAKCIQANPPFPTNPPRQDGGPVTATIVVPNCTNF